MLDLMKVASWACVLNRLFRPESSFGPEPPLPLVPWQTWHFCWKSCVAGTLLPVGLPVAVVVPAVLGALTFVVPEVDLDDLDVFDFEAAVEAAFDDLPDCPAELDWLVLDFDEPDALCLLPQPPAMRPRDRIVIAINGPMRGMWTLASRT